MALELRLQLKLTQQLIMTPQLQMAIKLLQLSRLELMDTIQTELEENPALEEVKEVTIEEKLREDIDWSNYLDEYNTPGRVHYESEERDTPKFEAFIAQKESLNGHMLWQFLMTKPNREEEKIASLLIGNLNKDGYLQVSTEEIAHTSGSPTEKVEEVLALIQSFDPIGVAARDLRECLLIQADHLGLADTIITDIIKNHLSDLEKKNYKVICKALKKNMDEVVSAINVIKIMEPKPGRQLKTSL
jgi:RNA polymerase sigma-54 factor